jgi:hypothetical protein
MIRRLGSVVLATSLLTACGTLDSALQSLDLGASRPETAGDSLPDARTDTTVQAELSDIDGGAVAGAGQQAAAEPPLPKRKPSSTTLVASRDFHPDLLVGLDFNATKALLGAPALQLEEPPAKIWAYNGGSCLLNVFFYPSVGDNVFRVLTYEVRSGDTKPGATAADLAAAAKVEDKNSAVVRQCFADLLQGREVPDAG